MFYTKKIFLVISLLFFIVIDANCFSRKLSSNTVEVTYNDNYASTFTYKYYSGSLNIPETITYDGQTYTVTRIGTKAFYDSYLLNMIIIPKTIEWIDNDAFHSYHHRIIWLPAKCPHILCKEPIKANYHFVPNENYFYGSGQSADKMGTIEVIPHLNSMFEVEGIKYVPLDISDRTCEIIDCNRSSDVNCLSITNTVQYKGVEMTIKNIRPYSFAYDPSLKTINISNEFIDSIGNRTFCESNKIYSITLPNNVTTIGDYAFSGCSSIISLELPNKLYSIGKRAFSDCINLQSINIPSNVISIGSYSFYNCKELSSIEIPKQLKVIDFYTFSGCSKLKDFEIPKYVETIKAGAFRNCETIKNLVIPDNVSIIETEAFNNCSSLTSVKIGEGYKSISNKAFENCSSLKNVEINCDIISGWFPTNSSIEEIVLGEKVISISKNSFKQCSLVKSLYSLSATPPICEDLTFEDFDKWGCIVYVPRTYVEKYRNAERWKDFIQIKEGPTVIVGNYTKEYGSDNPLFEYKAYDIELHGTPNIVCEATITSPVGIYPVILKKGSVTDNKVSFINGSLTIKKTPLTIEAGTYSIYQGDPIPEFELTYSGFKNNETNSVFTQQPIISCDANAECEPGEYTVTVYGADAVNYDISYKNGKLIVNETPSGGIVEVSTVPMYIVYDLQGNIVRYNTKTLRGLKKGTYIVRKGDLVRKVFWD